MFHIKALYTSNIKSDIENNINSAIIDDDKIFVDILKENHFKMTLQKL